MMDRRQLLKAMLSSPILFNIPPTILADTDVTARTLPAGCKWYPFDVRDTEGAVIFSAQMPSFLVGAEIMPVYNEITFTAKESARIGSIWSARPDTALLLEKGWRSADPLFVDWQPLLTFDPPIIVTKGRTFDVSFGSVFEFGY